MSEQASAPAAAAPAEASVEPVSEVAENQEALSSEEAQVEEQESAKEVAKELRKKYNLKVNNKAKDIELDLNNDEEVSKYLQKALAADEKFQEAASLRKQVEQLVTELKNNPLAILKHPQLGIDVKKLAEQVLNEELEEMALSPEQKRIQELERALKDREEREKMLEDEKRTAQQKQMEDQAMQELDEQITSALSSSKLPKSPYVVQRITDTMIAAMEMGHQNVTVEQIMPFVEEQVLGEINRLFESAPEDMFDKVMENVIGKKHLDKYRKTKVSKAKPKVQPTSAAAIKDSGGASKKTEKAPEVKPARFKDVFKL